MEFQRKIELKSDIQCDEQTQLTSKSVKRPFDVAFLMLPDDKLKHKQTKISKTHHFEKEEEICYNNNDEDEEVEVEDNPRDFKAHQKFFTQKQQIFDDPGLIKARNVEELKTRSLSTAQKSAFTKVNMAKQDPRISPTLSVSPDLSYQNSLSPSPPMIGRNYQNFQATILSPTQLFKNQQLAYQNQFISENLHQQAENNFFKAQPELVQPNFAKMRPMYRPEIPYNYQQFPNPEMLKIGPPEMNIRNPAAAILTSLLPLRWRRCLYRLRTCAPSATSPSG